MVRLETSCPQCGNVLTAGTTEASSCPNCGGQASAPGVVPRKIDAKVRRPGRTGLVAGLAVVAIGVAAAVCYPIVREELERARVARPVAPVAAANANAAAPNSGPSEPQDPSERCELRVFRDQPGGETIVVLSGPGKMTEFRRNRYYGRNGRLFRELVRQAVLLAVRDGLNLSVRDAVVGDPSPTGKPDQVFEVDAVSRDDKVLLLVCRGEGKNREVLLEKVVRSGPSNLGHYRLAVEALEPLTHDVLPTVLGKAGLVGKAAPKKGDDRVPDGVDFTGSAAIWPAPRAHSKNSWRKSRIATSTMPRCAWRSPTT